MAGGSNLRGYLYQQFRGDSQVAAKAEYHFPLFSIGPLDFRALGFYDSRRSGSVKLAQRARRPRRGWLHVLPARHAGPAHVRDDDARRLHVQQQHPQRGGGGLRFFLRSVAVPLVGFDAGYGIEARTWRFILLVGA